MHQSNFIKFAAAALASTFLAGAAVALDVDPALPAYAKSHGLRIVREYIDGTALVAGTVYHFKVVCMDSLSNTAGGTTDKTATYSMTAPTYNDTTIAVTQDGDGIKVVTPAGTSTYFSPVAYKIYARLSSDPTVSDTYLVAWSDELTIYFDRDATGTLLADGSWHVLAVCIDAVGNVTAGTHVKTVAYVRSTVTIPDQVTNFLIDALAPGRVTGFAAA